MNVYVRTLREVQPREYRGKPEGTCETSEALTDFSITSVLEDFGTNARTCSRRDKFAIIFTR